MKHGMSDNELLDQHEENTIVNQMYPCDGWPETRDEILRRMGELERAIEVIKFVATNDSLGASREACQGYLNEIR